ncbi:uncharacterized protein PG998_008410 [Apiospora kogelbergensis]|uniref:uncharacterized protein n=1 Tax=Apiospora kogelbergensis TaxID=1337665 RepID=UPI00312F7AE8
MPSVSKLAETLALPGFYFPPETDLPLRSSYRGCLHSHRYIPGQYKAATAEWHKARVGVNLRIVFEAICHFSEFPHTDEFWEHVEGIVKTYCQSRKAYLQQRWQGHETHPALISTVLELVDRITTPREQPPDYPSFEDWHRAQNNWHHRLQVVLSEVRALVDNVGQAPGALEGAQINPNETRPLSIGSGDEGEEVDEGEKLDDAEKPEGAQRNFNGKRQLTSGSGYAGEEFTPSSFDVPDKKSTTSENTEPSTGLIQQIEDVRLEEKHRAKQTEALNYSQDQDIRRLPDTSLKQARKAKKVEAELKDLRSGLGQYATQQQTIKWFEICEQRQKEEREKVFEIQANEARANWFSIEVQFKAVQGQLDQHQNDLKRLKALAQQKNDVANHATAISETAPSTLPAPSADSTRHDFSELLAYQPKEFIEAICGELIKLRAVDKIKLQQMDQQDLPNDAEKLAVSGLKRQLGKCIKGTEKHIDELV